MAVGPIDISGNEWHGPVYSSPAADGMSDEILERITFFGPKLPMRESSIGKINRVMDWLQKCRLKILLL